MNKELELIKAQLDSLHKELCALETRVAQVRGELEALYVQRQRILAGERWQDE